MSDDTTTEDYHREMQEGRAKLELLRGGGDSKRRRLTLSDMVELLLSRNAPEHSSVELSRNSKGETQMSVTVRTDQQAGVDTIEQAVAKAIEVYDTLRARYPTSSGFVGVPEKAPEPPAPPKAL